ncbi:class I SAM-dependent methyltransferase [Rubinisphaera margarita]|uniref:class I SAM-dependent methyltransferase n=1 Tax=Rubinisphaera margarita TaxID=2909586 RepID=UPI001EE928BF|nr:class I SAM-dependent methyltransferase [Rubinisphaera margarita]MCG6155282.1 class I SAM-dependent methyltransferase [Rubinisphaera margarita]
MPPVAESVCKTQPHASAPESRPAIHGCRFCDAPLNHSVVDLGMHPLCENFLTREQLSEEEPFYPLHAYVCERCYLVQVEEYVNGREIFEGEYAYFSSFSSSWLEHARRYVDHVTERFALNADSQVVELASNDGYLLQNFVSKGIPCLGIEPAANCAKVAIEKGVPTRVEYFGVEPAKRIVAEGIKADLLIANNCLAHVHDLNDFVGGMKTILADQGVLTVEFPTAVNMIELNQFDTIYQEHYCYFSLTTLQKVYRHHGMEIFDLDEIPTHGGSLRIYVRHIEDTTKPISSAVHDMLALEEAKGFTEMSTYTGFAENVKEVKRALLSFLIEAKREGKQVVGYGAPGKGNTLLNYCGIREDFLDYVVDRNPYKHGKYLPGTHIPVHATEKIAETRPDYILILPWNLKSEITEQLEYTREWGAKLVVPIPHLEVY